MSLEFQFNTAITGIDPSTGAWNEKTHNTAVLPLRGLIMQIDGVSGCHINRYDMRVEYLPRITSMTKVARGVRAAVVEIADRDGFFPIRGNKKPRAVFQKPAKRTPTKCWWIAEVKFGTDLFVAEDKKTTQAIQKKIVAKLAKADGARDPYVNQRRAYVMFNPDVIAAEAMKSHVEKVAGKLLRHRAANGYFPFGEPSFEFVVGETNYCIM